MLRFSSFALLSLTCLISGCKITQINSEGGYITSNSSLYDCPTDQTCMIEIEDASVFSDSFTATALDGYTFAGWGGNTCRPTASDCALFVPEQLTALDFEGQMEPRFVPDQFSAQWLAGKTFYIAYFGDVFDLDDNEIASNTGIVEKVSFSGNGGSASVSNSRYELDFGTFPISITAGKVHGADEPGDEGSRIGCPGTGRYLEVHYVVEDEIDDVEYWFYDATQAQKFAETLTDDMGIGC